MQPCRPTIALVSVGLARVKFVAVTSWQEKFIPAVSDGVTVAVPQPVGEMSPAALPKTLSEVRTLFDAAPQISEFAALSTLTVMASVVVTGEPDCVIPVPAVTLTLVTVPVAVVKQPNAWVDVL